MSFLVQYETILTSPRDEPMSANAQQIRKFTFDPAESNKIISYFLIMGLPLDAVLLIASHLTYDDFANLAVTCQYANQQFQSLRAHDRFKKNVLPTRRFLMNEQRIAPVRIPLYKRIDFLQREGLYADSIMSNDGKWLFVLSRTYVNKHHYWLDLLMLDSASPLKYRHVRRQHFNANSDPNNFFLFSIVGQDPSDKNPGVYLTGQAIGWADDSEAQAMFRTTRQIYSWHLKDKVHDTFKTVGERLPFCSIAVEHRTKDLRVYGITNKNHLKTLTLTHEGQVLQNQEELELALHAAGDQPRLSPNCKSLALLREVEWGQKTLMVVQSQNFSPIITVHFPEWRADMTFSITNDGGTLFYDGDIIPLDRIPTRDFDSNLQHQAMAHNGSGSICLGIQYGQAHQYVAKRKKISARDESTLVELIHKYIYLTDHLYDMNHFMQELSFRFTCNTIGAIYSLQETLNLRDPKSLVTILSEIPLLRRTLHTLISINNSMENVDFSVQEFLFSLSDAITMREIIELARDPNLHQRPRTGLVELALSPRAQALRYMVWGTAESKTILETWFNDPFQIKTETIGIIDSAQFFWGPRACSRLRSNVHELTSQYDGRRKKSEKSRDLEEIQNALINSNHPLLFLAAETSNGVNRIEVCFQSRNPNLDNQRKQVFPSGVVRAISKAPELKNVLLLNAVLKKISNGTFNRKQKQHLETTRLAMLNAVESNPSLREDMEQLLTTRFYGNDSVEECLRGSPYYQEVMTHLRGETPDVEKFVKTRRGRGCGV